MARLPGWMVIEIPKRGTVSADGKAVVFNIRIRKWHPAFWWVAFQIARPRSRPVDSEGGP